MPYTPERYACVPVNYIGESGPIPGLLLYDRDRLAYVRFQTQNWPHYDGWGLWATTALHSEHVVRADPHEPAVASLLGELEREATLMRQYTNDSAPDERPGKSRPANRHGAPAPKTTQANGVKPPLKPATKPVPESGKAGQAQRTFVLCGLPGQSVGYRSRISFQSVTPRVGSVVIVTT